VIVGKELTRLRRIFVRIQGSDSKRIVSYVTDVATQKAGKKTSKMVNSLTEITLCGL